MNDEERKKALKDFYHRAENTNLSYHIFESEREALKEALAHINRQQAEIERLQGAVQEWVDGKCLSQKHLLMIGNLQNEIEQAKSEAIKEFAERLRKEVANTGFGVCCTGETEEYKEGCLHGLVAKQKHCLCIIENLLAEMVGGENA